MDEADRFPPPGAVQRLLCFYLVLALLLALILVWRVNQPRQSLKAQLAEASAAMRAISIACQDYFTDTLELPRPSHLTNGTEADTIWNYQCLRENVFNIAGWQGPYLALDDWPFDPWGTPYGIDVLPCDAGCYVIVVSIGPNQVRDTPASLDSIGADCGDDLIIIGRVTMIPLPPAPVRSFAQLQFSPGPNHAWP